MSRIDRQALDVLRRMQITQLELPTESVQKHSSATTVIGYTAVVPYGKGYKWKSIAKRLNKCLKDVADTLEEDIRIEDEKKERERSEEAEYQLYGHKFKDKEEYLNLKKRVKEELLKEGWDMDTLDVTKINTPALTEFMEKTKYP